MQSEEKCPSEPVLSSLNIHLQQAESTCLFWAMMESWQLDPVEHLSRVPIRPQERWAAVCGKKGGRVLLGGYGLAF